MESQAPECSSRDLWSYETIGARFAFGKGQLVWGCSNRLFTLVSKLTVLNSPSKRWLDSRAGHRQPSAVKRLSIFLGFAALATPLSGQAPVSSFLWKLADQTLGAPLALASGATGMFWNPASIAHLPTVAAGVQVVRAPAIIGIDGLVAGATTRLTPHLAFGLSIGRLDMRNIVRTTSSPISVLGSIPIYDQMAALTVAGTAGPVALGFTLRGHDSRFDIESENGLTADIGIIVSGSTRLKLAAATHLQSFKLGQDEATSYLAAISYDVGGFSLGTDSVAVSVAYGFAARARSLVDHTIALDLLVSKVARVSGSAVREEGFTGTAWRPTVEVTLILGKYTIGVARSEGLNGIGPSYRINFDIILRQ